jgi:RNA polymerase sigma-70 factor (ECF subfamily)
MTDRATDASLLRRFAEGREEDAFAELVARHAPLVRRVCRRFLQSEHDVEDVAQATFLLLANRAGDVAWRDSVGGWVSDAARRLALHARCEIARRGRRETPVSSFRFGDAGALPDPACPLSTFTDEIERRDVRRLIDGVMEELPEKYRAPLALCYLEGKSNHEAAVALGYPVGSISRRLDRGRSLLRKRLIGRGVALTLLLAAAAWIVAGPGSEESASRAPLTPGVAAVAPTTEDRRELRELFAALERNDGSGLDLARVAFGVAHAESRGAVVRLAALDRDRPLDPTSASRLLATCVQCHGEYR